MLVISTDNHHPYYMCFVRNKENGAYFQAAQIYSPRGGTPKSGPIQSIFNSDLSLAKTDVLSKFHKNRFIFTRVIVITNFRSETTTATTPQSGMASYKFWQKIEGVVLSSWKLACIIFFYIIKKKTKYGPNWSTPRVTPQTHMFLVLYDKCILKCSDLNEIQWRCLKYEKTDFN